MNDVSRCLPGVAILIAVFCIAGCRNAALAQGFQRVDLSSDASAAFGVASGDFDGDGDIDAACTNFTGGSVVWVETVPDGPATAHSISIGYGRLRGIAAGDYDSDGDLDLAVAVYDEDRFVWLENRYGQGADSFLVHNLRTGCNGAWSTASGDIDADGDTDLVTAEYLGNVIRIFQQSNGQLIETGAFAVTSPIDVQIVDLDGDSDADILVAHDSGARWIENTGSGWSVQTFSISSPLIAIAGADLDSDGDIDIIGANYGTTPVMWWERTASGLTQHALPGAVNSVRDVGVADFDMDGDPDIVASAQYGSFRWWENLGGGTFVQRTGPDGSSLYTLEVVDYDQDGDPDVLIADLTGSLLLFYRNTMGVAAVISGYVRSAAGALPVAGMRVRALETGVTAYTSAAGQFTMYAAAGTYTLRTYHPCWTDTLVANAVAVSGETTAVDFSVVRPIVNIAATSLNLVVPNGINTSVPLPVTNGGDGPLIITTEVIGNFENDYWLNISPPSVVIPPQATFEFQVDIAPDTFSSQHTDYYGIIRLHTNACPDSHVQVAVMAYVLDAPGAPSAVPRELALHDVYPNPFNAGAVVRFAVPRAQRVNLRLYEITGRLVQTLAGRYYETGEHSVVIDGAHLASGVYLVALETETARLTRKALLLK